MLVPRRGFAVECSFGRLCSVGVQPGTSKLIGGRGCGFGHTCAFCLGGFLHRPPRPGSKQRAAHHGVVDCSSLLKSRSLEEEASSNGSGWEGHLRLCHLLQGEVRRRSAACLNICLRRAVKRFRASSLLACARLCNSFLYHDYDGCFLRRESIDESETRPP